MTLTDALREQLTSGWLGYSLQLPPNRSVSLPVEHLWTLKRGGIAFVLTDSRGSPACEAHLLEGRVVGEGPWQILDDQGEEIGFVIPDDRHIINPVPRAAALEYLLGWHQRLRASDLQP